MECCFMPTPCRCPGRQSQAGQSSVIGIVFELTSLMEPRDDCEAAWALVSGLVWLSDPEHTAVCLGCCTARLCLGCCTVKLWALTNPPGCRLRWSCWVCCCWGGSRPWLRACCFKANVGLLFPGLKSQYSTASEMVAKREMTRFWSLESLQMGEFCCHYTKVQDGIIDVTHALMRDMIRSTLVVLA